MILCPTCHHQNLPGALFCSECGAQLATTQALTTRSLNRPPTDALDVSLNPDYPKTEKTGRNGENENADIAIALHLLEAGKMVNLTGKLDYTIGRISEGQPILPDVDLSPYDAYSQGVSRLHATLKITHQRLSVLDLGSSNGTRVNGQKIVPHVEYPLSHGDIIALGKFKIQVLLHG